MTVELGGVTHSAGTTFCNQAPVTAAREAAISLRLTYVP